MCYPTTSSSFNFVFDGLTHCLRDGALPSDASVFVVEVEAAGEVPPCIEGPCPACTYAMACNFDSDATEDDGSCDFSCWNDAVACGQGTLWKEQTQVFVIIPSTFPTDLKGDGVTSILDLLVFLIAFDNDCSE